MTDKPKRSRWKRRTLIAFVLLLPVWYVALIGPARWANGRLYLSDDGMRVVLYAYGPVQWLCDRWPTGKYWLNAYVAWWTSRNSIFPD